MQKLKVMTYCDLWYIILDNLIQFDKCIECTVLESL
jgi:hypothetical protein